MYIIVVGGGRVGYYLSKALLDEGHEVLIIEKNDTICKNINEELGSICLHGDGCEAATLDEAGTGRANMLIAVTGDDEDNLVACQVAKHKFNVPRTISRIRNPDNEPFFKKMGIDVTVSTTNIILEHIEEEVPTHPLTHLLAIEDKGLEIVEVKITPELTTIGKSVRELSLPEGSKLSLIIRETGKHHIPTSNTILQAGDRIIALIPPELEEPLRAALRGAEKTPQTQEWRGIEHKRTIHRYFLSTSPPFSPFPYYQIKSGYAAHSPELGLTAHGYSPEVANRNLERLATLFFRPFEWQGRLIEEVKLLGLRIERDSGDLAVSTADWEAIKGHLMKLWAVLFEES